MDDLTIGYNIAEILTLEPSFLNMLGFTYEETKTYLRYVLDKYTPGASEESFEEIWQLIVSNYDGYRFSPIGEIIRIIRLISKTENSDLLIFKV